MKVSPLLIVLSFATAGCNDANFRGRLEPKSQTPTPVEQGAVDQNEKVVSPQQPVHQAGQTQTEPKQNQQQSQEPVNTSGGQSVEPIPITPDPIPEDPSLSKLIQYGGNGQVFHLGDSHLDSDSSCAYRVEGVPLAGTAFQFFFELTGDAAQVEIAVADICGVGYPINTIQLIGKNGKEHHSDNLKLDEQVYQFKSQILMPGRYEVRVVSPPYSNSFLTVDHDDFLVGQVLVRSTQPMRKETVQTKCVNNMNILGVEAWKQCIAGLNW